MSALAMPINMSTPPAYGATFAPLPPIAALPGNRRAVILNWREDSSTTTAGCKVCDQAIKELSLKCNECKAHICIECTKENGKSTQRCKDMAADHRLLGCWCGIAGGFNMEFNMVTPGNESQKRKRGPTSPPNHATACRPGLGFNEQYSTRAMPAFLPLNQRESGSSRGPLAHKKIKLSEGYRMPVEHLDETTTVIIGCGIIGLLIAFELANKADTTGTSLRVVVLDVNEDACLLASEHCAGLLSLNGMDERWAPLNLDFMPRWQDIELARDPDLDINAPQGLRIHVGSTAAWIKECCENLGVEFGFGIQAHGATQDRTGRISSVEIGHVAMSRPTESIPCSNLIVAAGAFTTNVYARLFPNSHLSLENNVRQVQKLQLQDVDMRTTGNNGIIAASMRSENYKGKLRIIADETEHSAEVFMTEKNGTDMPLAAQDALKHNKGSADSLLNMASKHLVSSRDTNSLDVSNVSNMSRSAISTGTDGCPVIGKVPSQALGDSEGVFLAYGFGKYGTTLAPIVGEIITQLVCREEPFINLSAFKIQSASDRFLPEGKGESRSITASSSPKGKRKTQAGTGTKKSSPDGKSKTQVVSTMEIGQKQKASTQAGAGALTEPKPNSNAEVQVGSVERSVQQKKGEVQKPPTSKALQTKPKDTEVGAAESRAAKGLRKTRSTLVINSDSPESSIPPASIANISTPKPKPTRKTRSSLPNKAATPERPLIRKVESSVKTPDSRPKIILRLSPNKDAQKAGGAVVPEIKSTVRRTGAGAVTADDRQVMAQKAATILAEPKRQYKTPPVTSFRAKKVKASVTDGAETKVNEPKEDGKEMTVTGIGKKGGRQDVVKGCVSI